MLKSWMNKPSDKKGQEKSPEKAQKTTGKSSEKKVAKNKPGKQAEAKKKPEQKQKTSSSTINIQTMLGKSSSKKDGKAAPQEDEKTDKSKSKSRSKSRGKVSVVKEKNLDLPARTTRNQQSVSPPRVDSNPNRRLKKVRHSVKDTGQMELEHPTRNQQPGKTSKNKKKVVVEDLDELDLESEEYGHFRYEDEDGKKKRELVKAQQVQEEKNLRRKKANQANQEPPRISYPSYYVGHGQAGFPRLEATRQSAPPVANLPLGKKPLNAKYADDDSDDDYKIEIEKLVESSDELDGFGIDSEDSDEALLRKMNQMTNKQNPAVQDGKKKGEQSVGKGVAQKSAKRNSGAMEEESLGGFIVDDDEEFEFEGKQLFEKVKPHQHNTRSRKNSVKKIEPIKDVPNPKQTAKVDSKKASRKPTPANKAAGGDNKGIQKQAPSLVPPEGGVKIISNPLDGEVIVISGELNHTNDRKEMQSMIITLGGSSPGSVSKKTTLLISGHILPDGRPPDQSVKYREAQKLGKQIMTEEEFDQYMIEKTGRNLKNLLNGGAVEIAEGNAYRHAQAAKLDLAEQRSLVASKMEEEMSGDSGLPNRMWADKYAPKTSGDLCGNNGIIDKLRNWLLGWEEVHIFGIKKEIKVQGWGFNPDRFAASNVNAKAALLSGPPGIGKTSTARLIGKELGYTVVETNASDLRNKNSINSTLGILRNNATCGFSGEVEKTLILMDEVDGMSSDRGGSQELIKQLKESKVPIICICNDRKHPKMRSLANSCYDLQFSRPGKVQIENRIRMICEREGLTVDNNSLNALYDQTQGDIRQMLNFLQMWRRNHDTFIFSTFNQEKEKFNKDEAVMINGFDAAQKILNRQSRNGLGIKELLNYFFIDYDLIPLLVHENILDASDKNSGSGNLRQMEKIARACDSMARGEGFNQEIRGNGNWELLPNFGFSSCIYPSAIIADFMPFCKFPQWFGKYSSTTKIFRELRELREAIGLRISSDRMGIKLDYCPALLNLVRYHLIRSEDNKQAMNTAIEFYEHYELNPDLVKEHLVEVIYNPEKTDLLGGRISSKVKAAVTKGYNERNKESVKVKKSKRAVILDEDNYDMIEEEDEEEDDGDEDDKYEIVQTKNTKPAAKNTKAGKKR